MYPEKYETNYCQEYSAHTIEVDLLQIRLLIERFLNKYLEGLFSSIESRNSPFIAF